jgi:hypothetical protein
MREKSALKPKPSSLCWHERRALFSLSLSPNLLFACKQMEGRAPAAAFSQILPPPSVGRHRKFKIQIGRVLNELLSLLSLFLPALNLKASQMAAARTDPNYHIQRKQGIGYQKKSHATDRQAGRRLLPENAFLEPPSSFYWSSVLLGLPAANFPHPPRPSRYWSWLFLCMNITVLTHVCMTNANIEKQHYREQATLAYSYVVVYLGGIYIIVI